MCFSVKICIVLKLAQTAFHTTRFAAERPKGPRGNNCSLVLRLTKIEGLDLLLWLWQMKA